MLQTFPTTTTTILDARTGATLEVLTSYHGPREVVIKRLGWRRLEEAAEALMRDGIRTVKDMGGAEAIRGLQALASSAKQPGDEGKSDVEVAREVAAAAKKANPLAAYDQASLALWGAVSFDGAPVTQDAINDLEPDVLTGIARTVLHLARPGLFETEEARKNV